MYKYQNVSKNVQTLTSDGDISPRVVEPGSEVLSSVPLENPNFKYVGEEKAQEEQPDQAQTNQTNKESE